jgi:hypothetical protein
VIQNVDSKVSRYPARMALALLACAAVAPAAHARSASSTVLVPPASLPAEGRQPGEAMFLHDTLDGRTLLYIEHVGDSGMAVLDVTDPAHIKGQGSVPVDAAAASPPDQVNARELKRVFDVPGVREQVANDATGTTFLLTDAGLYVVRQPSVEMIQKLRELNYAN